MRKMSFLFAFAVIGMLLACAFADFTGNATVQVLDAKLRPIEGAQVSVTYRLNDDNPNFKTPPKLTNESGLVDLKFTNIDYAMQADYYKFQLSATYQNTTNTTSGDVLNP
ncbi:MAG TPA: hypothetical protein PLO51_04935, partial [Candidatus Micrarchaeota archaeon]|nr:hypothetical protein [Candidatus Micrarchaeota archaeon]